MADEMNQQIPSEVVAGESDSAGEKLCVSDLDIYEMRVLVRVDYNCPLDSDGKVSDDTRVRETLDTLKLLKEKGAKCIVLLSHLGRPKGRDDKMTLYPVALCLSKLMNEQITFIDDTIGSCVEKAVNSASGGRIILLENVRFYEQEENTDDPIPENVLEFRESLTRLADVYVDDAFGCAHRAHSSIVGVNMATRAAGLLMKKELDVFSKVLSSPDPPFLAILGGAKVHDKIKLIENLLDKVNTLVIGGGMAFTFLKVLYEMEIGQSLYDEEGVDDVKAIAEKADQKEVKISLPVDFVTADKMDPDADTGVCSREDGVPKDWMALDIGEKSIEAFKEIIGQANTIIWNGPMGVFEWDKFENGTRSLLEAVADRTAAGATTVIGGGDTASAATKWNLSNRVTHVSTGGGATLELLEGKVLPGVAALTDKSEFENVKQREPAQGSTVEAEQLDEGEGDALAEEATERTSKIADVPPGAARTSALREGSLPKESRPSALKEGANEANQRAFIAKGKSVRGSQQTPEEENVKLEVPVGEAATAEQAMTEPRSSQANRPSATAGKGSERTTEAKSSVTAEEERKTSTEAKGKSQSGENEDEDEEEKKKLQKNNRTSKKGGK